jgi:glycosyltransferase involved in cell wall biosynthesis
MRIVFLARLFHPHIGGVEKHVYEISKRLIEHGHHVTVITEQYDTSLPLYEDFEKIQIYRIPVKTQNWFKKYYLWRWMIKHRKIIKLADIIHCHDVFFWYLPLRFLYPRKKVFTTFHGYEGDMIPGRNAVFMHKISEVLSNGNVCVGDYLRKWYGTRPTFITYGGVDIPSSPNDFPQLKDSIRCVFLGRLVDETGFMTYLKGLKILTDQKYQISLTVLGDGVKRKEGEQFCQNNNIKAEFKGFIRDIDTYLKNAHFVFTSRYLGILESFSLKRFVFAEYNNPIKYDYFILSPFSDMISVFKTDHELADEIIFHLHNVKIIHKKTDAAYQWVREQSWDHMVDMYLKLWKQKNKFAL